MQSAKFNVDILKIKGLIFEGIELISENCLNFGYRERLLVERPLYLILKIIGRNKLNYDLKGFSKVDIDELISHISQDKPLLRVVSNIWEFKIFIKSMSSSSAYIRGDILSNLNINKKDTFSFIEKRLKNIYEKIEQLKF